MNPDGSFPRLMSGQERAWLDFLLPEDRPGYRPLREQLRSLPVLGEGRWGAGDLILGARGRRIDPEAGMRPVAAYGEINATAPDGKGFVITLAVHYPDEEGLVEFQIATQNIGGVPENFRERSAWTYSRWLPGGPCPATGAVVREIPLNPRRALLLVISPVKRVLWLHDAEDLTNTLVPVTNYYNELMLLKGIRDPERALDHKRLFSELEDLTDGELRGAFVRYNSGFPKVDPARIGEPAGEGPAVLPLWRRIANALRGRGTN